MINVKLCTNCDVFVCLCTSILNFATCLIGKCKNIQLSIFERTREKNSCSLAAVVQFEYIYFLSTFTNQNIITLLDFWSGVEW